MADGKPHRDAKRPRAALGGATFRRQRQRRDAHQMVGTEPVQKPECQG
jgi:hypothetical protein